jgi:hypothetical protein
MFQRFIVSGGVILKDNIYFCGQFAEELLASGFVQVHCQAFFARFMLTKPSGTPSFLGGTAANPLHGPAAPLCRPRHRIVRRRQPQNGPAMELLKSITFTPFRVSSFSPFPLTLQDELYFG